MTAKEQPVNYYCPDCDKTFEHPPSSRVKCACGHIPCPRAKLGGGKSPRAKYVHGRRARLDANIEEMKRRRRLKYPKAASP